MRVTLLGVTNRSKRIAAVVVFLVAVWGFAKITGRMEAERVWKARAPERAAAWRADSAEACVNHATRLRRSVDTTSLVAYLALADSVCRSYEHNQ